MEYSVQIQQEPDTYWQFPFSLLRLFSIKEINENNVETC